MANSRKTVGLLIFLTFVPFKQDSPELRVNVFKSSMISENLQNISLTYRWSIQFLRTLHVLSPKKATMWERDNISHCWPTFLSMGICPLSPENRGSEGLSGSRGPDCRMETLGENKERERQGWVNCKENIFLVYFFLYNMAIGQLNVIPS